MKNIKNLAVIFIMSFSIITIPAEASDVFVKLENIGDTAAIKKYNNLSLNKVSANKKFSLNVKKENTDPTFKNYNTFDIKSKKPTYVESVLMRKGNSIQAIPLYRYTLPF